MEKGIFLSVIIPCRNEEHRIGTTLDVVAKHLKKQNYEAEVIIVDADSTDKTVEIVNSKKYLFQNLHILEGHKSVTGKGIAIRIGMITAKGRYRCFIDADNGAPFEQIDKLLEKKDKYDIVIGSRYIKGGEAGKRSLIRSIISRGGNFLMWLVLGLKYKDTRCPLKLFSEDSALKIFSVQKLTGFGFDTEVFVLAKKFKYKVIEIPVKWYEIGESKVNAMSDSIKSILELFQIRWYLISGAYKVLNKNDKTLEKL